MKPVRHSLERPTTGRSGFSLIEVLMATAILLGSVVVLSRLVHMGRTQAQKAQRTSEAQRVCENTLNEIVLGLRPLQAVERAPLNAVVEMPSDQPGQLGGRLNDGDVIRRRIVDALGSGANTKWLYSVRLAPHQTLPELTIVTVEVRRAKSDGARPTTFMLTRWVRTNDASHDAASPLTFGLSDASSVGRSRQ